MLPATLMALLAASSVFSQDLPLQNTPLDPFRAISLHVPKQPEYPVCCLRPLPSLEPAEDEAFLSFEEWKAKRIAAAEAQERESSVSAAPSGGAVGSGRGTGSESASEALNADSSAFSGPGLPSVTHEVVDQGSGPNDFLSPHFRVPIIDRFNYASTDCSARTHTSHRSAKSPYAILSAKKDKYMLSPCAKPDGEKQFVVVELCDDVRIDTVQLANFEFFSGVFKDFTVSVAKTYTTDASEGWTHAGTYRAKNVRGVQSFHPPTSLRDFYRYIRIDFHSHYGNEYYCPVSLLRVYGLTHLEEWKWDIWEAEAKAKRGTVEDASAAPSMVARSEEIVKTTHMPGGDVAGTVPGSEMAQDASQYVSSNVSEPTERVSESTATAGPARDSKSAPIASDSSNSTTKELDNTVTIATAPNNPAEAGSSSGSHSKDTADPLPVMSPPASSVTAQDGTLTTPHKDEKAFTVHDTQVPESTDASVTDSPVLTFVSSVPGSGSLSNISSISQETILTSKLLSESNGSVSISSASSSPVTTSISTSSAVTATVVSLTPVPPPTTGGESIYRTIMNRLTALEGNTTLYARYVEEQTAAARDVLRRLSEDVGRLDGIGKAQAQMYQRSLHEFERYRKKLEIEHRELLARVNFLADEVMLERRLGIAQLCLLLAVLVFMGLTRGSRVEGLIDSRSAALLDRVSQSSAMRDWGRRTLSFSGDWVSRFRVRSPTRTSGLDSTPARALHDKLAFPLRATPLVSEVPTSTRKPESGIRERRTGTRPRTPTSLRSPSSRHVSHRRPVTPTGNHGYLSPLRPPLQRSNSHGTPPDFVGVGPVPRSAKRWARSAHVHEVKAGSGRNKEESEVMLQEQEDHRGARSDTKGKGREDGRARLGARSDHDRFQNLLQHGAEVSIDQNLAVGGQNNRSRMPSPLRMSTADDWSPGRDQSQSSETDGDAWVDTDVDGSEKDVNASPDGDVFA